MKNPSDLRAASHVCTASSRTRSSNVSVEGTAMAPAVQNQAPFGAVTPDRVPFEAVRPIWGCPLLRFIMSWFAAGHICLEPARQVCHMGERGARSALGTSGGKWFALRWMHWAWRSSTGEVGEGGGRGKGVHVLRTRFESGCRHLVNCGFRV